MPLYASRDPLPIPPRRVIIGGTSGAGKSTFARHLAATLDVPYLENDSIYHGPGWTVRTEYESDLRAFISGPAWVIEWQGARDRLAQAADTLVWLDYPTWLVMYRVLKRTLTRVFTREVLWAGNIEPPIWAAFQDEDHIVRWAWRTRGRVRSEVAQLLEAGTQLQVVRLRWPHEAEEWLVSALGSD